MAKILTGPLAAGLSGKLGPVVFHQTKFGQIVQSKAKPRTYTTAAAMATKSAFGRAARCYQLQGAGLVWNLNEAFGKIHKTGQGQFVSLCSEAIRDGGTQRQTYVGQPDIYTLGAITPGGPADYFLPFSVTLLASPDYALLAARVFMFRPDGSIVRVGATVDFGGLQIVPFSPVAPPFLWVIVQSSINPTGTAELPFAASIGPAAFSEV